MVRFGTGSVIFVLVRCSGSAEPNFRGSVDHYIQLAIQSRRLRRRTSLRGLPAAARFARLGSLRSQEASLFCKRGSLRSQKNLIWNTFYFGFSSKRGSLRSRKNLISKTFWFLFVWQTWLASLAKESNLKHVCFWFLWQTWLASLAKKSYLRGLLIVVRGLLRFARKS